ncbi:MAG: PKD domain-containing protein [Phycisphaerae bacterium]
MPSRARQTGGGCLDLAPPVCLALLGTPQGPGTTCATTICPLPAPLADYGDAPDGIPACQGTIFCTTPSSYPTLFGTTNAVPGRGAPYHTDFTDVWLGPQPNSETAEPVAFQPCCSWLTPPPDCDDAPIVLCLDGPCTTGVLSTMSGCPEAVNIPFGLTPSGFGYWIYETAVGAGAPDVPRFVNVTVDWTLSGTYGDVPGEWVVVDASVPYTPGTAAIMLTAPFPTPTVVPSTTGGLGWAIEPFWTRFTVSRDPVAPAFPAGDWDGSGPLPPGYVYGETEDIVPFTDPQTPLPRFPDCDHNGVPDLVDIIMGRLEDANHNRIPDVVEPGPGDDMPFDADRDGDVDQADYGAVQACLTGSGDPGHAFDPTACSGFDRDFDLDVDRADLEAFLRCVSGPGLPADPDCGRVRMLRITQPANGAVLSGITRVVIEHPADLPLTEIVSMQLQSLPPSEPLNWIPYATLTDPELDSGGVLLNTWDVGLDPVNWPEPDYQFRAALRKTDGQTLYSDPIELRFNRPPTPQAQAFQTPQPGSVLFKAFHSWDDHGPITRWHWDFGDSTSAEGPAVEHTFANPKQTYHVVLTVEDDQQAEASAYYTVRFQPRFSFMQDEKCICKKMTLRTEGAAFGADGAPDGKKWPAVPGHHDGGTLGPLHGNPGNSGAGGEKNNTGFAFEVVTDVEGNPAKCTEIQLIRRTTVLKGVTKADCDRLKGAWNAKDATCTVDKSWTGKKADLNKDGTDDIDVSTAAKCGAAGGAWDEASGTCRLAFPQEKLEGDPPRNVARYGPDSIPNQPQGAAERPYDFKKYVGNRIIWWDAPRFGGVGNGSTQKADFIAIVRGTDGKYCYKTFSLELEKKKGQDTEKLTETGGDCAAASVPGVP